MTATGGGPAPGLYDDAVAVVTGWAPADRAGLDRRDRTLTLLSAGPVAVGRSHPAGHLTASAVVLDHDRRRVLLCLHGTFHRWMQLGGHLEPDDPTLAAAALREATEESGIDGLTLYPEPIDLDIHPVSCRHAGGASHHHDIRYVAVAPPDAVARVSPESAALAWFPPYALPSPLASATARLVPLALAAVCHPAVENPHPEGTEASRR